MILSAEFMIALSVSFLTGMAFALPFRKRFSRAGKQGGEMKELTAVNEELIAANEGLIATNYELALSKEELLKSEEKFSRIFKLSPDAITITQIDNGLYIDVNDAFLDILGYTRWEVIGKTSFELNLWGDMEQRDSVINEIYQKGDFNRTDLKFRRKNGEMLSVAMSGKILELEEKNCFLSISRDMTQKMKADDEKKKLEYQLLQAQKMEAVGTLAGGIAHDFNNVLGGIVGTVSLMKHQLERGDFVSNRFMNYIDIVERSGKRAADMVQQLLMLSRKHEMNIVPHDLNSSVKNVVQICRNTFDKSIDIHVEYSDSAAMIKGDPFQVEQVLINLCINASHAMTIMRGINDKQEGTLSIAVKHIFADKHFCKAQSGAEIGWYWMVSHSDTGVGIESGNLHKIFDPFFTTKDSEQGTGLGLAMVYSIVHQHGGFIDVYSEPGAGSTFSIYFPELTEKAGNEYVRAESVIDTGEGLILVIDDEEIVRQTAENVLVECGYEVISAGSGRDGIDAYSRRKDDIKAVLLDMAMPGMSGKDVYLELKRINPGVKVLLASGFRQDGRVLDALSLGISGFIQKPYSLCELSSKIKAITGDS